MSSKSRPKNEALPPVTSQPSRHGQDLGHRAFTGAVRPHNGVYLAGVDLQINPASNLGIADARLKIFNIEHVWLFLVLFGGAPQLHAASSKPMPSSFCASTANSIWAPAKRLAEPVDDHPHGIFGREAALVAVKDSVLANLRRRSLVLDLTVGIAHLDVRGT